MAKTNLEKAIEQAVGGFALDIVRAIKSSTLQDLVTLQTSGVRKSPGRPGRKPGAAKIVKTRGRKPAKPGRPANPAKPERKTRVVKNYPKCAFPRCTRNRFVRGKGFCGVHWKEMLAGKIKEAGHYKKKGE